MGQLRVGNFTLIFLIPLVFSIGIFPVILTASAQSSDVPDWVKNNAKWWSEKKVSEQEYLDAIKFLIDNQIIKVQTSSPPLAEPENDLVSTDETYLKSIQVEFAGGDLTKTITIDTFSRYESGKDATLIDQQAKLGYQSYFQLDSLPSRDKAEYYNIISHYVNHGKKPLPFDVKISGIMSDGSILLSSFHEKCTVVDYSLEYQDSTVIYQFSKEKQGEIRDHSLFYCGGANVGDITHALSDVNSQDDSGKSLTKLLKREGYLDDAKNSTKTNIVSAIPEDNDRVKSFVVHFFDGDLKKVHSFNTFKVFSPFFDSDASLFTSTPQFHLESLPSSDKRVFYELLSRYINPVKLPLPFNVSIDSITGDGTVLHRWNYEKCDVSDYTVYLEDYKLRYFFSGKKASENRETVDFECAGLHLQIHSYYKIGTVPIKTNDWEQHFVAPSDSHNVELTDDVRAMTHQISYFGGEMEQSYITQSFPKVESLSWNNSLVPANHPNQYQYGFTVESNPSKDKSEIYHFISKYINPGKSPEPFDVDITLMTGNGTILYAHKYTKCSAVDFDWYLQEGTSYYGLSSVPLPEMRERYTNYCNGYTVEVP